MTARDTPGRVAVFRFRLEGETAVLVAASERGQVAWPVAPRGAFSPASCPPGSWPWTQCRCCQVDLGAALRCCAAGTFCAWPCTRGNL